jgi:hypothetical protein
MRPTPRATSCDAKVCAIFVALVAGCSSTSQPALDGGTDLGETASGDLASTAGDDDMASPATVTFAFTAQVQALCFQTPLASCAPHVLVTVTDLSRVALDDAMVVANGNAIPSTGSNGNYYGAVGPYVASYDVSVTRAGSTLTATLPSPSDYSVSVTPNPPTHGASATVDWTPSGDANTQVRVIVHQGNVGGTPTASAGGQDTGSLTIPTTSFPAAGAYGIEVQRELFAPDQSNVPPGSTQRNVILVRSTDVTAQ